MGDVDQVPAAPGSLLAGIRKAREAAEAKLYLDLRVPRIEPALYVRFRPIKQREINGVNAAAAESEDPDKYVISNSAILAHCCVAIFTTDAEISEGVKFGSRLAELLGMPDGTGTTDLVRGLYLTDGDIIGAAQEVTEWSGEILRRVDEETAKN